MLIEMDPDFYHVPPYLGPSGWVGDASSSGDGHRLGARRGPHRDQLGTGRAAPLAGGWRTMSERHDLQAAATEAVDKAEAAATRRRWINLGEFVAVAGADHRGGQPVAELGRSQRRRGRQAATQRRAQKSLRRPVPRRRRKGGAVLTLSDPDHASSEIDVAFPPRSGVGAQSDHRRRTISARWFERGAAQGDRRRRGQTVGPACPC